MSCALLGLFLVVNVLYGKFFILAGEAQGHSITLGGIFDLSSPLGSIWGNDERDGFILAVEDFRKSNPQFKITYVLEDSAYSNTRSVSALKKITSLNKVKYLVGPTWDTFVAVVPICGSNKFICFAPSNHESIFYDPKNPLRYSFTVFFDEREYATILADKMMEDKRKRVAVFSTISTYFETLSNAFLTASRRNLLSMSVSTHK